MFFILRGLSRISSMSAMSLFKSLISSSLLSIYSLFIWRSLISATYSACTSSMPKPIIKLGTTSDSSAVSRIIFIALSISKSIFCKPKSKCSFSRFFPKSKAILRFMQLVLKSVHSLSISRTPITLGVPSISTLKLQAKESCKGVSLNSFCIRASGSTRFFKSKASFKPERSVSSLKSDISFILPNLTKSTIRSIIASTVVVGGISVTSTTLESAS